MLIVGRAIQGCGGSGILNGALTILAAAAPISKRPSMYLTILSLMFTVFPNLYASSYWYNYVYCIHWAGHWTSDWWCIDSTCFLESE